jgi:hypothetical protein
MLLERLEPGLEEYVPINQYDGFKKKCGTADAILISNLLGNSAYNQRMADIRCYVDLTKAYDKVNRELLWEILHRLGIPDRLVNLIISFHNGASAQTQVNGVLSSPFPLHRGLKQGSVLSSILFNIFFGALIRAFEGECAQKEATSSQVLGAHIKYNLTNGVMSPTTLKNPSAPGVLTHMLYDILYADDCVIFASFEESLQSMMESFDRISTKFGMKIAIKKTQVLCNKFLPRTREQVRVPPPPAHTILVTLKDGPAYRLRKRITQHKTPAEKDTRPQIAIGDKILEVVTQFKYLGCQDSSTATLTA